MRNGRTLATHGAGSRIGLPFGIQQRLPMPRFVVRHPRRRSEASVLHGRNLPAPCCNHRVGGGVARRDSERPADLAVSH